MSRLPLHRHDLGSLARLVLVGVAVGLTCLPLNLVDTAQAFLQKQLPAFTGSGWTPLTIAIASSPLLVMPLLLALQAKPMAHGAGSGIPQTLRSLEHPERAEKLLGASPTVARIGLWSAASLALMPLGREGPVVHLGAAMAQFLQRRFPRLFKGVPSRDLMAIGAGAGLAGGFNSPLMGTLFVMEELTGRYSSSLVWPALVACSAAALVSNLSGIPIFPLGLLGAAMPEWQQLALAVPIGMGGGLIGGLFARLLLFTSGWLQPRVRSQPWRWGLALGAGLALLALGSGGWSGGDGEALMGQLLVERGPLPVPGSPLGLVGWILVLASRLVAPLLALGAGVPGGLIDPALTIGAVFGSGVLALLGSSAKVGVALGMAAGLAGATQLPMMTVLFSLRLAGDQQLLFGILLSAVLGAYAGRRLESRPIYHALADLDGENKAGVQSAPRR